MRFMICMSGWIIFFNPEHDLINQEYRYVRGTCIYCSLHGNIPASSFFCWELSQFLLAARDFMQHRDSSLGLHWKSRAISRVISKNLQQLKSAQRVHGHVWGQSDIYPSWEHKPAKSMGGQDKLILRNRRKGRFIILSESILYGNGTSISFMMAY